MNDKITVNVDDLRTTLRAARRAITDETALHERLRLGGALAEHDKAEQERLGQLVMVHKDDVDVISQYSTPYRWATTFRYPYYEAAPKTVEALGEFYPHQTDHAYQASNTVVEGRGRLCVHCDSPEWAHTPPVPDWQTDENVLVVEDVNGDAWVRSRAYKPTHWYAAGSDANERWDTLLTEFGPVIPVGYRRDPHSITIPKSALDGLSRGWFFTRAVEYEIDHPVTSAVFYAIADALEADQ